MSIETVLLQIVRLGKIPVEEAIRKAESRGKYDNYNIRCAVWDLLADGKLKLTNDRCLTIGDGYGID